MFHDVLSGDKVVKNSHCRNSWCEDSRADFEPFNAMVTHVRKGLDTLLSTAPQYTKFQHFYPQRGAFQSDVVQYKNHIPP
jgi:hypothetical protein